MAKVTKETIQNWIAKSVPLMLSTNNGAVYYYRLRQGISFMLAWIMYDYEENNKFYDGQYVIEASVRKNDSSYLIEDWNRIGDGIILETADENNRFADVADTIYNIAVTYVEPVIWYTLPNNKKINLLTEMRMANFRYFDEPIADLRKFYYESITQETEEKAIERKIDEQCFAFADFLGTQYGEIQTMISIDDLSNQIKQTLLPGIL